MFLLPFFVALPVFVARWGWPAVRPQSLDDYLARHTWNAASNGPMLVVDPEHTYATVNEPGLSGFERKEFHVGSITAVAPEQMTLIDTSLKNPPNLYDGLSRKDKIIYLMSLLDDSQWKTAAGPGIGLGDLNRDQQAVFRSILPTVFTYEETVLGKDGSNLALTDEPATVTLSKEDEAGVRIHFFYQLELGVRLVSGGSSAIPVQQWEKYPEGRHLLARRESPEDRSGLYGVQFRKVVDNISKASRLDYRSPALDGPLGFAGLGSIESVCKAASFVSGIRILCDVRVSKLPIKFAGLSAKTRDVLQALALCIGGTYRRVGDLYVLTSDLEGIATKRLKIAAWRTEADVMVRQRKRDWMQAIQTAQGAREVGSETGTLLVASDEMERFMDQHQGTNSDDTMPASDLPAQWQQILIAGKRHFAPEDQIRTDVCEPQRRFFWNFVLPDGRQLQWEDGNWALNQLLAHAGADRSPGSDTVVKPLAVGAERSPALAVETESPGVAIRLASLAKQHGFAEIWIQTWNADCLDAFVSAATAQSLGIRLVMRPWAIPPGVAGARDQTLLAMSSGEAQRFQFESAWFQESAPVSGMAPTPLDDLMSPTSPGREAVWTNLAHLARHPGLLGSVVLDTEPSGYEPAIQRIQYSPPEERMLQDLGYSENLRSVFLADHSVDPIDLIDTRLRFRGLDMSLPFFGDPEPGGPVPMEYSQMLALTLQWNATRAEANLDPVRQFVNGLGGEILLQPRNAFQDFPWTHGFSVVSWKPGTELPTATVPEERMGQFNAQAVYWIWQFGYPMDSTVASRVWDRLTHLLEENKSNLAVDVTAMPIEELPKFLDTWFKP